MDAELLQENIALIDGFVGSRDQMSLMGNIAVSLLRIANAQEELLQLAKADVEGQVAEAAKSQAETLATEMVADQTKRSFIGRR